MRFFSSGWTNSFWCTSGSTHGGVLQKKGFLNLFLKGGYVKQSSPGPQTMGELIANLGKIVILPGCDRVSTAIL
jgi:hypothetical protein